MQTLFAYSVFLQSLGRDITTTWDSSLEEKSVEESVSWVAVSEERRSEIIDEINDDWIIVGKVSLP